MTFYLVWRAANIGIALITIFLFVWGKVSPKWFQIPLDQKLGMMTLVAYPLAYVIATSWAWASGVEAGPWTGVMGVAIILGFLTAWVRSD